MIYHSLITLQLYGFPIAEIGVVLVGIRAILDHRTKPLEMDVNIPSFGYIPTLHLLLCKAYL